MIFNTTTDLLPVNHCISGANNFDHYIEYLSVNMHVVFVVGDQQNVVSAFKAPSLCTCHSENWP